MTIKPTYIRFKISPPSKPKKLKIEITFESDELIKGDSRPIVNAAHWYAKLIAKEINEGVWDKS